MIDFRLPENRIEGFIRYVVWQLRRGDVDTALPVMNYIFKRNEFNDEQRLWFCFIYANTYDVASTLAIWNEMPDYNLVDIPRLTRFMQGKGKQIHYEKDIKPQNRALLRTSETYLNFVKGGQRKFFNSICPSDGDGVQNYWNLRNIIMKDFYKFGRYVSWFYMQALKDCAGVHIEAPTMHFGKDSKNPTNAMLYLLGKEELASTIIENDGRSKRKQPIAWSKDLLEELEFKAAEIIHDVNSRFPDVHLDRFLLETALCSYFKLYRRGQGRYLGFYLDRLNQNVKQSEAIWTGVDYDIVRDWLKETYPDYQSYVNPKNEPDKKKMEVFLDTGNFPELSMYLDLENK